MSTNEIDLLNSACLILEGIPPGTAVGIDYHIWCTGTHFRGVANIPAGFHMLFHNATDQHGNASARTTYMFHCTAGDVVVKTYDKQNEDFVDQLIDSDRKQMYLQDLPEIARFMMPYPSKECSKWSTLIRHIDADFVNRVQPVAGKLNELSVVSLDVSGAQKKTTIDSRLEHKEYKEGFLNFSPIPHKPPPSASPQDITRLNLDSSHYLQIFIQSLGEERVLGEIQLAYVCFMIAQVYDAFDHWKALLTLVTSCKDLLTKRPKFFVQLIAVVDLQMREFPELFLDIAVQDNFLCKTFKNFFENIGCVETDITLIRRASLFKGSLGRQFEDWELDEEEDDERPVVVVET